MHELIIVIKDLTKYYEHLHVLDNLNFNIRRGEFISIVGPSGCGKTTLLKILGGLIKPTSGNINIFKSSPSQKNDIREFGFVFQNPVLLPWRTTKKNIELPLEIYEKEKPKILPKSFIELVGLSGFENYYPKQLSGGMQQRASIARALILEPSILLMDEPFGALDEITRDKMNIELLRIWTKIKTTIIFVTHYIPEAVFLSDRIIVVSKRPAKIEEIVEIDLPRPREPEMRNSTKYNEVMKWIRELLKEY